MLIPKIIQQYKAAVTRAYNLSSNQSPFRWQKSYYDHIIRDLTTFDKIKRYIRYNPLRWENGSENIVNQLKSLPTRTNIANC